MKRKIFITTICLTLAVLASCGPSHKMIAQDINSPDVETRRNAARQMRGAKKITSKMTPALLEACRDKDTDVRMYAFFAIKNADPREEGVVAAILDGMSDTSVHVRRAVASSLCDIDPFPSVCLPPMVKLLSDPDDYVRRYAYTAFANMEGLGIGSLMRHIDTPDPELRLTIVKIFGAIGPQAKTTLPKLRAISQNDEDIRIKEAAAQSIKFIED